MYLVHDILYGILVKQSIGTVFAVSRGMQPGLVYNYLNYTKGRHLVTTTSLLLVTVKSIYIGLKSNKN